MAHVIMIAMTADDIEGSREAKDVPHSADDVPRSSREARKGGRRRRAATMLPSGEVVAELLYVAGDLRRVGGGTATADLAADIETVARRLEGDSSPNALPRALQRLERIVKQRRR